MTNRLTEALKQQILALPSAPQLLEEVYAALAEEAKRRQLFYEQVTEESKAEFINGEVILHSPAMKRHVEVTSQLFQLLNAYVLKHTMGFVGIEKLMITRNDYEPDICYFATEQATHFSPEQMLFPAPDFVVEVLSKSTEKRDRGIKWQDYAAHGVGEYWIIDPEGQTVEQYLLRDGNYNLHRKVADGELNSQVVRGFTIPVRAIFEASANIQALAQILA
ncbi:MAG: Uma2 family endonuclease [Bacteroidota bacterium]